MLDLHSLNEDALPEALAGTLGRYIIPASHVAAHHDLKGVLVEVDIWARQYLCSPHPQLGRPGPVCPYMPRAHDTDGVYYAPVCGQPGYSEVVDTVRSLVEPFMELSQGDDPRRRDFLSLVAVFVDLPAERAPAVVVAPHHEVLKSEVVEQGLMLGEFHPGYDLQGVRNPKFRSGEAPAALLALRHMVQRDAEFLAANPKWLMAHGAQQSRRAERRL